MTSPIHLQLLFGVYPDYQYHIAYHVRVWTTAGLVFQGAVTQGTSPNLLVLDLDPSIKQGVPGSMVNSIKQESEVDECELPVIFLRAEHILTIQIISMG